MSSAVTFGQLLAVALASMLVAVGLVVLLLVSRERKAYRRGYEAGIASLEAIVLGIEIERAREQYVQAWEGNPPRTTAEQLASGEYLPRRQQSDSEQS